MKKYLGDSVYVAFDGFHLVLTTENGLGPSNTIYLDPGVYESLLLYVEDLKEANKAKRAGYLGDVNGPGSDPDVA